MATGFAAGASQQRRRSSPSIRIAKELQHLTTAWTQRELSASRICRQTHFSENWPSGRVGYWSEATPDIRVPCRTARILSAEDHARPHRHVPDGRRRYRDTRQADQRLSCAAGIRHDCKRHSRQHRLNQLEIVVAKAVRGDPSQTRSQSRCPGTPLTPCQQGSVRRHNQSLPQSLTARQLENRAARRHRPVDAASAVAGLVRPGRIEQIEIEAIPKVLIIFFAAHAPHQVHQVPIAPPGVGVAGPLPNVAFASRAKNAPKRHPGNQPAAGRNPRIVSQPGPCVIFTYGPKMQFKSITPIGHRRRERLRSAIERASRLTSQHSSSIPSYVWLARR